MRNRYLDAYQRDIPDDVLKRIKSDTDHLETESFEDIKNCEDWRRCLAYHDYTRNEYYYPNLISRNFRYTEELDSQFILAKDLLNNRFIEYLYIGTNSFPLKKLPPYLLYNAKNLKVLEMGYFSYRNLKLSEFIMTNRKLEVINLWRSDLEIIGPVRSVRARFAANRRESPRIAVNRFYL